MDSVQNKSTVVTNTPSASSPVTPTKPLEPQQVSPINQQVNQASQVGQVPQPTIVHPSASPSKAINLPPSPPQDLPPNGPIVQINPENTMPSHPHHFPLMIVTMILILILTGFSGSFLYFKITGNSKKTATNNSSIKITPPATVAAPNLETQKEQESNPFIEPTLAYQNPFAQGESTTVNMLDGQSSYQNPFADNSSPSQQTGNEYQNPFEGMR